MQQFRFLCDLSVFVKEFASLCNAVDELCSQHFPEKSAALNASHETPAPRAGGQGLPQERVQDSPGGDVRISPSLSCNTEFPSIMFLFMPLVCSVENA